MKQQQKKPKEIRKKFFETPRNSTVRNRKMMKYDADKERFRYNTEEETGKNTGYTLQNRQAKKQIFQVHHPTMQKMYE